MERITGIQSLVELSGAESRAPIVGKFYSFKDSETGEAKVQRGKRKGIRASLEVDELFFIEGRRWYQNSERYCPPNKTKIRKWTTQTRSRYVMTSSRGNSVIIVRRDVKGQMPLVNVPMLK